MSTSIPKASTKYLKKDGTLSLSRDGRSFLWTPVEPPGAAPKLNIPIADITNLQQSVATASKVSLKIVVKQPPHPVDSYVFTFTSPTAAREEQAGITDVIRKAIQARTQDGTASAGVTRATDPLQSAAMAVAKAVSSGAQSEDGIDDSRLISDATLQESLLASNPQLRQRFSEALKEKPSSITISQFAKQFWGTRVHLLRAHAIEKKQSQGTYNVLSVVKIQNIDGTARLNISQEQIQLVFSQHPLVRRVYNECVPKIAETDFWSRFFVSRLSKKLKGEKITELDSTDPVLDKYLNDDEEDRMHPQGVHVPLFLDLEGNDQNHSQRRGNQPDREMRPGSYEKVPILRVLNDISEKMMAHVTPSDGDPLAPIGMDEGTFNEMQLRDLRDRDADNRVMLSIKDQRPFLTGQKDDQISRDAALYSKQSPTKVLSILNQDFGPSSVNMNLETAIGVHDDSDSDDEEGDQAPQPRVGSAKGRAAATTHIFKAIKQRRAQTDDFSSPSGSFAIVSPSATGLSSAITDSLTLTHNTTVEFLHYFWTVFLSGDPERAGELQQLVETLDKSLDRIKAIADAADAERNQQIETRKRQIDEHFQRTGRKVKFNPAAIPGGGKAVNQVMAPAVRAIKAATDEYRRVLAMQMAQAQA